MIRFLIVLLFVPLELFAMDLPGPEGVTIEVADDAAHQFVRLRAIGESDLLIGDRKDVQRATKVATLKAKAAIARYLGEDVKTEELVEQISKSANRRSNPTAKPPRFRVTMPKSWLRRFGIRRQNS